MSLTKEAAVASTEHYPKHLHLDRRAARLAAEGADARPDDLLTTKAVAAWFGVSVSWLEIGRSKGYGPPFIRVAPRRIRYRRSSVLAWLAEREHRCTIEYDHHPGGPGRPKKAS